MAFPRGIFVAGAEASWATAATRSSSTNADTTPRLGTELCLQQRSSLARATISSALIAKSQTWMFCCMRSGETDFTNGATPAWMAHRIKT
eukprot:CAMPEP_0204038264 /NCGR_PEP_ID=MMETSP0360-20130528/86722_1 /ASSEMBLY_ACC=CAM_ASM_000342 /TAXON_ID=268821 /ORGANISM="Scrippsiella Hangoei, Strain SHTV-5" /LENGTH=89 /DNA_ID=CAMNT_0050983901 /DNA_START=68 /DNA_END=334 /DNA_ORIENTATION=-